MLRRSGALCLPCGPGVWLEYRGSVSFSSDGVRRTCPQSGERVERGCNDPQAQASEPRPRRWKLLKHALQACLSVYAWHMHCSLTTRPPSSLSLDCSGSRGSCEETRCVVAVVGHHFLQPCTTFASMAALLRDTFCELTTTWNPPRSDHLLTWVAGTGEERPSHEALKLCSWCPASLPASLRPSPDCGQPQTAKDNCVGRSCVGRSCVALCRAHHA